MILNTYMRVLVHIGDGCGGGEGDFMNIIRIQRRKNQTKNQTELRIFDFSSKHRSSGLMPRLTPSAPNYLLGINSFQSPVLATRDERRGEYTCV